MSARLLTFDLAEHWVPTRRYADGWARAVSEIWLQYLASYRERVHDVYGELAIQHGTAFTLTEPVEVLAIASLAREWIFVRPAAQDSVTVVEKWQDPLLARSDMHTRVDHEQRVRKLLDISGDYRLVHSSPFINRFDVDTPPSVDGTEKVAGIEAADYDAASALDLPRLRQLERYLEGRQIDERALAKLRNEFGEIHGLTPPQRGRSFEAFFADLLSAHGCSVERGKTRRGEQVDLFVHAPFRAIIECRWSSHRLQPRAISDLAAKLGRRPAIVAGIYVSMSGFTSTCRANALHEPHGRTILLWDNDDVETMLSAQVHAKDLFDTHVSDLVRRYHPGES
jgi:hypothetical protein